MTMPKRRYQSTVFLPENLASNYHTALTDSFRTSIFFILNSVPSLIFLQLPLIPLCLCVIYRLLFSAMHRPLLSSSTSNSTSSAKLLALHQTLHFSAFLATYFPPIRFLRRIRSKISFMIRFTATARLGVANPLPGNDPKVTNIEKTSFAYLIFRFHSG